MAAVAILGINQATRIMDTMNRSGWFIVQMPIVFNILCVIAMAIVLKKNLSRFYSSIVVQMDNLSSEKKDLTRRINVCSVDEIGAVTGMVNAFCEHLVGGVGCQREHVVLGR